MTTEVRCPMRECRRRVDLDALPPFPEQPQRLPCMHFIAAWGPDRAPMVEAVLFGLQGNRELVIRNVSPGKVRQDYLDESRSDLEAAARRFGREATAEDARAGALFGDPHERNHVAREFAQLILGPDPMAGVRPRRPGEP